jgi:hypothetical protein
MPISVPVPADYFFSQQGIHSMNFKPADTRRRYAKTIDGLSEASDLGTVIAPGYSWPMRPSERNLKQLRMYVQVIIKKLEKEFPDFPAVFFPDVDRNGNLQAHVLVPTEGAAQMGSWLQEKWPGMLKMRRPDTARDSGRPDEVTFIDEDILTNHGLHGVSHAAAKTKSTSALDGVRHKSPGSWLPGSRRLNNEIYPSLQKPRPLTFQAKSRLSARLPDRLPNASRHTRRRSGPSAKRTLAHTLRTGKPSRVLMHVTRASRFTPVPASVTGPMGACRKGHE